jgi:hypothetical protein
MTAVILNDENAPDPNFDNKARILQTRRSLQAAAGSLLPHTHSHVTQTNPSAVLCTTQPGAWACSCISSIRRWRLQAAVMPPGRSLGPPES